MIYTMAANSQRDILLDNTDKGFGPGELELALGYKLNYLMDKEAENVVGHGKGKTKTGRAVMW